MKSLGKLRKIALHRSDAKEKKDNQSLVHNELVLAAEDMVDMRSCYDSLLSAAAATANSAYEFSESLRDMGTCLVEKIASHDEDENSKVLSMLGEVQFELQKLVDNYRSHVNLTITTPSESLLNELRTVEEMKRQCDEKRSMYEYMVAQQRDKGKSKSGKMEVFSSQQIQEARDAYDEEASLCVFRLKSLKQGQCRSLLTQAARHHAAQLNFFRKGLKFLEAIEPHVRLVTERQHIDYQLSGLEDMEDEGMNSFESNNDGELSFDHRANNQGSDAVPALRNSMELDQADLPRFQFSAVTNTEVGDQIFNREHRAGSHSAPIFAERKFDPAERIKEMQTSARKFHSYVLPTPVGAKNSIPAKTNSSVLQPRPISHRGNPQNMWHSSPLEPEKHAKDITDGSFPLPIASKPESKLKHSSSGNPLVQLPTCLPQGLSVSNSDAYDTKKIKRQAHSGPLTSKPSTIRPSLSASGPITSSELPKLVTGLLQREPNPPPSSSSPKVSPSASPPIASSPRISELHELPRPPISLSFKPITSSTGHSTPLVSRNQELSPTNKSHAGPFSVASVLPAPPLSIPRSFSIPSRDQRAMALHVAQLLEVPKFEDKAGDLASPPLTPISLSHSGQVTGEG